MEIDMAVTHQRCAGKVTRVGNSTPRGSPR